MQQYLLCSGGTGAAQGTHCAVLCHPGPWAALCPPAVGVSLCQEPPVAAGEWLCQPAIDITPLRPPRCAQGACANLEPETRGRRALPSPAGTTSFPPTMEQAQAPPRASPVSSHAPPYRLAHKQPSPVSDPGGRALLMMPFDPGDPKLFSPRVGTPPTSSV